MYRNRALTRFNDKSRMDEWAEHSSARSSNSIDSSGKHDSKRIFQHRIFYALYIYICGRQRISRHVKKTTCVGFSVCRVSQSTSACENASHNGVLRIEEAAPVGLYNWKASALRPIRSSRY